MCAPVCVHVLWKCSTETCWIMLGWIGCSLNVDSESGGNCWVLGSGWQVEKMCFLKRLLGSEGSDVGLCRTLFDRRWYFKIRVNICWTTCRYLRWNFGFYSTKQVLPTCPPLPVGSNLLVSWSRCQRSEVRKGKEERPPPHDELELNWWKCCERSVASTVTSAFCLSLVCVVLQLMGVFPLADLSDVTHFDKPSASNALFFRLCIFAFTTPFWL